MGMRVEVILPSDMESDIDLHGVGEGTKNFTVTGMDVRPLFYQANSNAPLLYLVVYGKDDEILSKYVLSQSGATGKLHLLNRTRPVRPRYEIKMYDGKASKASKGTNGAKQ